VKFGRAKTRACALISACLLLLASLAVDATRASAAPERRVRFGRGQTKARVSGRLSGMNDGAVFVARARRGQRMRVTVVRSSGPIRSFVISPSGEAEGQPGTGTIFDEELTETGAYRVRVNESQMGEAWRGSFLLEIEIK
jgi:hypothetical protein